MTLILTTPWKGEDEEQEESCGSGRGKDERTKNVITTET